MPFRLIEPVWNSPLRPVDGHLLLDAFDAMAEMEREVLGFLDPTFGLMYDYGGSNLPEKLSGKYPLVLHLPRGTAQLRSIQVGAAQGMMTSHPGGLREHSYPFAIYWMVGNRAEEVDRLIVASHFWVKAVDQAYCANGSLGGMVHESGVGAGYWGSIDYAGQTHYGWIFNGTVKMQYVFQGGG